MGAHVAQLQQEAPRPNWGLTVRILFRFCVVYFSLFSLTTQIVTGLFPIPKVDIPDPASLWPVSQTVLWVEAHILRVADPVPWAETGSGDRIFDWALLVCLLIVSALATVTWSILDRKRANSSTLAKWFLLGIRFALAGQMITYGMDKVIPLQMSYPSLTRLLEPYHNFYPMSVLWSSIGASPGYEVFAGCAELLGGILLIFPQTATYGALVCLTDMIQVFMLNMTYDVPVKILSFHLILFSLLVLSPQFNRLMGFFFLNRPVEPAGQPALFLSRRKNRIALWAQVAFGIWLLGMNTWSVASDWNVDGGGRPRSPLYGIWNIDELSIDGQIRSPLVTDYDRWRRTIFDSPESVAFQRMDDSFARFGASINTSASTIALTKGGDKNWTGNLTFQRIAGDQLLLDGAMGGHPVHMRLSLVDSGKFMLVSRGFHWVQESPFNR